MNLNTSYRQNENFTFSYTIISIFMTLFLLSFLSGYSIPNFQKCKTTLKSFYEEIAKVSDTSENPKNKWQTWSAVDSMKVDSINDIIYLYGGAKIASDDVLIEAKFIKYDRRNSRGVAIGSATQIIKSKNMTISNMDRIEFK